MKGQEVLVRGRLLEDPSNDPNKKKLEVDFDPRGERAKSVIAVDASRIEPIPSGEAVAVHIPALLAGRFARALATMREHQRPPDETPSSAALRLIAIGIEEWENKDKNEDRRDTVIAVIAASRAVIADWYFWRNTSNIDENRPRATVHPNVLAALENALKRLEEK